jgi:CheY-like chemotaxis protein
MIAKSRKILLADDDVDDRELFEEAILQIDKDIIVISASSGGEALELLLSFQVTENLSLIILDFNMPDLSGAEVFKQISHIPQYERIPKIIWSTSNSMLYQNISKSSGASHYFQKPQSFEAIVQFIRNILSLG